jgi:DNA invertase Pin-like site-specific DNA recombinase
MNTKRAPIVAYYRVSTKQQGESGLGLDGQRTAVEAYARSHGARVIGEYTEVESGKNADRPELQRAVAHSRRSKATMVVAKLDRLSRNVAFLSALLENGFDFVACDNPHVNRLTLHILAALAEHEAKLISERTKAALAATKARGVKLGSQRPGHFADPVRRAARLAGLEKGRTRSAKVRRQLAHEAYADLLPSIRDMRRQGATLQAIADKVNTQGHTTRRGKSWTAMTVHRILELSPVPA